jgi:hypothetical protein
MPNSAALRNRRYRRRRRSGLVVINVLCDEFGVIDALIEQKLIGEDESENRQAVGAALSRLIQRWQESVTRRANDALSSGTMPTQPKRARRASAQD